MDLKWSEFNLTVESEEDPGSVILCNTVGFNVFKTKMDSTVYTAYSSGSFENLTETEVEYLKEQGFLVASDFNEREYCDHWHSCGVYDNSMLSITIIPTDACNFRCVYCFENPDNSYMAAETENAILKYLRLNLRKYRSFQLGWFGGEPLVRKEQVLRMTKEINELCKKYGVKFFGSMSTNGYELDEPTLTELVRNRILSYQICIDGNELSHNQQRPHFKNKDSYQRILNNIRDIKNNCPSSAFVISLRSNITDKTEAYLDDYLNQIKNIVGNDRRFEITFQGVREWGGKRIVENEVGIVDSESRVYSEWYTKAARLGLNSAERLQLGIYSSACSANFVNGFLINPDGSVHKCALCYYNKETRGCGRVGRITPDGKMEIDETVTMRWMSRKNNHIEKCDSCKLYSMCKGGVCPYFTNILKRTMDSSHHCDDLYAMTIAKLKCMDIKNMIPDIVEVTK